VYKAIRGEVQSVAVKVLKNKEEHATFGREIAILKNCRHPNIVQFQVIILCEPNIVNGLASVYVWSNFSEHMC
jgi:serine/threonine protein kinase